MLKEFFLDGEVRVEPIDLVRSSRKKQLEMAKGKQLNKYYKINNFHILESWNSEGLYDLSLPLPLNELPVIPVGSKKLKGVVHRWPIEYWKLDNNEPYVRQVKQVFL